jgi:hypothetical protein
MFLLYRTPSSVLSSAALVFSTYSSGLT